MENSVFHHKKHVKKSSSLLSRINENIINSSQNLINPDEFYTRLFKIAVNNKIKDENRKYSKKINPNQKFSAKFKAERKKTYFVNNSKTYKEEY